MVSGLEGFHCIAISMDTINRSIKLPLTFAIKGNYTVQTVSMDIIYKKDQFSLPLAAAVQVGAGVVHVPSSKQRIMTFSCV